MDKPIPYRVVFVRRESTPEELAAAEERQRQEAEFQAVLDALTPRQRRVYDLLSDMIDGLYDAGVDVSYFPREAYMVLVETARKIS